MAPRQAPAGVQGRRRGALQGHHRGLRGAAGPAGEQGGARRARRRRRERRRHGGGESGAGREEARRRGGGRRAPHAAAAGGGAAGQGGDEGRVQRLQQRRRRPASVRRVLQLRGAQGAAAGAQGGVHPRGALQRLQQGGQVHPRRCHQERTDHQEGGDADHPGEARDAERRGCDAGGRRRRAAGLPDGRRRVRRVGAEAQALQAARRRPGAQGAGAAGERAHRVAALLPAALRRQVPVRVQGRGHLPRVRQGRQGRRHARRRRGEGRARGPHGEV